MDLLANLFDLLLHVDQHLTAFVAEHGAWVYLLLIVIIFAETGLVVAPWLPGDSLLFVVGTLAGLGSIDIELHEYDIRIAAGSILVVTMETTASTASVDCTLSWLEI